MRKPIIAGNWKMNKTIKEGLEFIEEVKGQTEGDVEVLVCAPFTLLKDLKLATKGTNIKIGAQNMHYENSGAFTGEVAPANLVEIGMDYVIIGHSERREYYGETDAMVNEKIKSAFFHSLQPIVCVGESLEQREANETISFIHGQLKRALQDIPADQVEQLIIAYEPIWAIGTGKTATADQAEEVCKSIRDYIAELYTSAVAESVRIQYGGSVKANNAREILSEPNIDGALVGGASLIVDEFNEIIMAAQDVSK